MEPGVSTEPLARDGESTFVPGELIADRFRVVRALAVGGQGEVYEAFDETLGKPVALKTLRQGIATDSESRNRFKREVVLAHRVTHPNVCRTFDAGFVDGIPYLTMELYRGDTIADRIARGGRMTTAEALPIIEQIAAGLAAAHAAGVVHRDLKSANVLLVDPPSSRSLDAQSRDPRAVVSDFGIARDHDQSSGRASGTVLGSPAYMAPEQVAGGEVGPAADIYALGVVIYEMVTGELPFSGGTPMVVAMRRLHEPPRPPRSIVADLDPRWEAVILRCLAREPAQRFADVLDVPRALADPAAAVGSIEPPSPRWRIRTLAVGVVLAGLAAVVALTMRADDAARVVSGDSPTGEPSPRDPEAARHYAAAASALHLSECAAARDHLREVTAREPGFARGHAALARAYACLGLDGDAKRAATTALELSGGVGAGEHALIEAVYWIALHRTDRALPLLRGLFAEQPSVATGVDLLSVQIPEDAEGARATFETLRKIGAGDDLRVRFLALWHSMHAPGGDFEQAVLDSEQLAARAKAMGARAIVANIRMLQIAPLEQLGQLSQALARASEGRALMDQLGDPDGFHTTAVEEARLLRKLGRIREAIALGREAETRAGSLESPIRLRNARLAVAHGLWAHGELDAARETFERISHDDDIARQPESRARVLCFLARVRLAQGYPRAARELRDQALAVAQSPAFATSVIALDLTALIALAEQELEAARVGHEAMFAAAEKTGQRILAAEARNALAMTALAAGDAVTAQTHALIAIDHFDGVGQLDDAALGRAGLALAELASGRRAVAEAALAPALARAAITERPRVRATVEIAAARLAIASGDPVRVAAAQAQLERVRSYTEPGGLVEALEARFWLGKLAVARGERDPLAPLAAEVEMRGLVDLSRRIARVRGER